MPLLPIGVLNCECDYLDVPQDMPGENVLSIWLVYWFVIVKRASFITSHPQKLLKSNFPTISYCLISRPGYICQ